MLKKVLLPIVIVGTVFLMTGCGHYWGCGGGHHNDHNNSHAHYQGCGHPGYQE